MTIRYIDKAAKYAFFKIAFVFSWILTFMKFKVNGVVFHNDFIAKGIPIININLKGKLVIGKRFCFHSGRYYNMIGRQQRCYFIVSKNAELLIGDNVGISGTAFVCTNKIKIGNNVRIGGGVVIYDTDFHSLNVFERVSLPEVITNIKTSAIDIKDGVFIGAHSIILKGVIIGENSIVGAGSVVAKSIPQNEIWAGNPAKFISNVKINT